MRAMTVPETGPKLKLVEAAERLFAERGFDAISVRDVTAEAGANVAAVNYHFGSRAGLIAAVMARYVMPVNDERLARLEAAERKWAGKAVPLEEIVDAFSRPLITRVRKSELSEKLFCKLLGRIFGDQSGALPPELEGQFQRVAEAYIRALSKALPTVPQEELIWRIHFMAGCMLHMLSHQEMVHRLSRGLSGTPSIETTFGRFMRFVCAGLREGVEGSEGGSASEKGPQGFFDF